MMRRHLTLPDVRLVHTGKAVPAAHVALLIAAALIIVAIGLITHG